MAECEICGAKSDKICECQDCGALFCDVCGDVVLKVCEFCLGD